METKSVFTPYVARRLLRMGNPILDIKPCYVEITPEQLAEMQGGGIQIDYLFR